MHRKASGLIAGLVLEWSSFIAEAHPMRPPVISTPHHPPLHKLIAYINIKHSCIFGSPSVPKLYCFNG